jgi:hypothetical protein
MDGWMERDVYCISVLQEGIFNCSLGAFFFMDICLLVLLVFCFSGACVGGGSFIPYMMKDTLN